MCYMYKNMKTSSIELQLDLRILYLSIIHQYTNFRPNYRSEVQLINVNSKMRKIEIIFKAKKAHLPLGENIIFSKDIDSLDLQYFMRLCRI